jgi:hypothetical protein
MEVGPIRGLQMNTEHQALAEVALWLLVLLSMAGLSGEMLRASGTDLGLRQVLQNKNGDGLIFRL